MDLARWLGSPANDLCCLGEGNVSFGEGQEFWIKASGQSMDHIKADGFVLMDRERTLGLLAPDAAEPNEELVRAMLNEARLHPESSHLPSTESFMHAELLGLSGVSFVAHTHPTTLLSVLALREAEDFARRRLFPDEIVFCGPASCFVPYFFPGLPLAKGIRTAAAEFSGRYGQWPKCIWLQNHGLIALGKTPAEIKAICMMSAKAARVILGALATGKKINWLTDEEVARIAEWPDEHFRSRVVSGADLPARESG